MPLPAPMRDPKTLRTLVLLDLESHPPSAAIDRVRVLVEPTPGRVLQWTLFERAQPAPEQVATLVARLTALMGDGHVGSPALGGRVAAWGVRDARLRAAERGPAELRLRQTRRARGRSGSCRWRSAASACRCRCACRSDEGRPVRVTTDRRGMTGGVIVQAAGPWRTSGEWWNDGSWAQVPESSQRMRPRAGIVTSGTSRSRTARCIASTSNATWASGSSRASWIERRKSRPQKARRSRRASMIKIWLHVSCCS